MNKRLLTLKEINDELIKLAENATYQKGLIAVTKAQDAKTAKAVRKEIGEWLGKHLIAVKIDDSDHPFSKKFIESLRKGEMPEEGD